MSPSDFGLIARHDPRHGKEEKGSGRAIIATARKLSKVVWYMLRNDAPFDPQRMTDAGVRKIAEEMQAALPAA